jgi:hypothetical protein
MYTFKSFRIAETTQKAMQAKIVDLDKRLDKHSNTKRVLNKGKVSSQEFKQILKKVADGNIKVTPPKEGQNDSSAFDMFSFEFQDKAFHVHLSNPVVGRGTHATVDNETSLILVLSAMYAGAKDKSGILQKMLDAKVFGRVYDKDGTVLNKKSAEGLVAYMQEKQDWLDSHYNQSQVFIKAFTKTPKKLTIDHSGIDIWQQAQGLFKAEKAWGGKAPDKDKWNPGDVWIYYEDLPDHATIDELNTYLYNSVKNKKGVVGVSLKKGQGKGKLQYFNIGKNPEIKVDKIEGNFGKNFTLGVDLDFIGDGLDGVSLAYRIFQGKDSESIRGEGTGKNAMQGKVKLEMIDQLSGGTYADRIRSAGGPNILQWDKKKQEYSLTANGLSKFKAIETKWHKMKSWKNVSFKRNASRGGYDAAFGNGVVGFLKELNKGYPIGKKHKPWKENQGKSTVNSKFQSIELIYLLSKMPQKEQNDLAAGLLKYAKSMSKWSSAFAKLS